MKTYEDLFVETVLREMDGFTIDSSVCICGAFGGVPYIFYDSELDVTNLFSKKIRRSRSEQKTDDEVSADELEYRYLKNLGLANDNRNMLYYKRIKYIINKGNSRFEEYLKRFKSSSSESERITVARSVVFDIKIILEHGCTCPGDYMFLRRFGLYA